MSLNGRLILLFTANTISGFASGITFVSVPWYIVSTWETEGGKSMNAAVMAVITLITIPWSLYAGSLIDKISRKRIWQFLCVIAAMALGLAAYGAAGKAPVPPWTLILGVSVTLLSYSIHYPNLYAFVQELVPRRLYQRVNTAIEIQGQSTNFLGMTTAGILMAGSQEFPWWPESLAIQPWTMSDIFFLDAVTYSIAFVLISLIPYTPGDYVKKTAESVWTRIRTGFHYLGENRRLLVFGLASYVVFFAVLVTVQAIMPLYINGHLELDFDTGAAVTSELEMFYCLGAILAGLLSLSFERLIKKGNLATYIIVFGLLAAAVFTTWGLTRSPLIFARLALLIGLANAGIRILRISWIVYVTPNHLIGRVNSIFNILNVLARSAMLLVLTLPFFTRPENGSNVTYALFILAGACLVGALILILNFRKFKQEPVE